MEAILVLLIWACFFSVVVVVAVGPKNNHHVGQEDVHTHGNGFGGCLVSIKRGA